MNCLVSIVETTFVIPFALPFSNGQITIQTDSQQLTAHIKVKQKNWENVDDEGSMLNMTFLSMRMSNDRFGQLNYTLIKLQFRIEPRKKYNDILLNQSYYVSESITVINRVIDACRMVTDAFYLPRNLIRSDFVGYQILCMDDNRNVVKRLGRIGAEGDDDSQYFTNRNLNEEELSQISDILIKNIKISLEKELAINAQDYFVFGNYRISIIEIQSVVEILISSVIRRHLNNLGKTSQEIDEILKSRLDDLKPYLNQISPTITGCTEWKEWKQKCYDVRNAIVHRGFVPNKHEAEDALKSGSDFINLLIHI